MKTLLKSFIVWLMLVAIPFQGFAAAGMLTRAPAPAVAAMAPGHCAGMAAMHDGGKAHAGPVEHASPHHHAGGKCTTCASCCFGAVMAPPVPTVCMPGAAPGLAAFHLTDDPVARVDLALPERPPKTSLA